MSLLDDESLNASERELISIFERRATGSVDAAVPDPASAEDEVEPVSATPPGPGTQTDPSAAPAPSPEGQVEGPDPDAGGAENDSPVLPTGDEGGAVDDGASSSQPSTPAFTFAGRDYAPEDLARAVQVASWHEQLSDQQVVAIDALLSGQYKLVPANDAVPSPSPSPSPSTQSGVPTPATSSASSAADAITDDGAGEWLDPRAQQEITALRNQLAELQTSVQQSISPLVQQQMDQSMQQRVAMVDTATKSFAEKYSLTPEQVEPILTSVTEAQILPALVAQHGGDVPAAINRALDLMFWSTPSFRDPYVQARTAADLASLSEQERAGRVKQQQMTALSASGGSVPRREARPVTKEDRHQGMVEELRTAMNGS